MKWKEISLERYEEGQEWIGVYEGTRKEEEETLVTINKGEAKEEIHANFKLQKLLEQVEKGVMVRITCLGKYTTKNNNKAYNWKVEVGEE